MIRAVAGTISIAALVSFEFIVLLCMMAGMPAGLPAFLGGVTALGFLFATTPQSLPLSLGVAVTVSALVSYGTLGLILVAHQTAPQGEAWVGDGNGWRKMETLNMANGVSVFTPVFLMLLALSATAFVLWKCVVVRSATSPEIA